MPASASKSPVGFTGNSASPLSIVLEMMSRASRKRSVGESAWISGMSSATDIAKFYAARGIADVTACLSSRA